MCHTCDREKSTFRRDKIVIVVLFVIIGVLAALVFRFNHLLNNAYDLQRTNHIIACHIDQTVSNDQHIYECRDVPIKSPGGK